MLRNPITEPDLFTTAEVADALGVQPGTVSRWCRTGGLRCERRGGAGARFIRRDDLVLWLRQYGAGLFNLSPGARERINQFMESRT